MNNDLLNSCIENFVGFLKVNFNLIEKSYATHKLKAEQNNYFLVSFSDYFDDWAQANWELLVERVVCSSQESVEIYGSGSDYEAATHSRVFFQKTQATHEIVCNSSRAIDWIPKTEIDLSNFEFDSFVSISGQWFQELLPFDHILFTEKGAVGSVYIRVVIPRQQVVFSSQVIEI